MAIVGISGHTGRRSEIRLEGFTRFDFDLDVLKPKIRAEGNEIKKIARRLVSRRSISRAGEFSGQRTGQLKKTINVKMLSGGLAMVVTHTRLNDESQRYPFMLAYGSSKTNLSPREDHMDAALNSRRSRIVDVLKESLRKTVKAK